LPTGIIDFAEAATQRKPARAVTLLDQLRERRATARAAAEAVLTRSAESGEPMSRQAGAGTPTGDVL
jgi:hypothetical protein